MTLTMNSSLDRILSLINEGSLSTIEFNGRGEVRISRVSNVFASEMQYLKNMGYVRFVRQDRDIGPKHRYYRGAQHRFRNIYAITEMGKEHLRKRGYKI